ncbi:MAG: hypothetical protein GY720_12265 [bacterium]|nr:hypothetical protein [bacterium]
MGLGADQIFAAALDVDLGDGIILLALVGITFFLIITLAVWMVRGTQAHQLRTTNDGALATGDTSRPDHTIIPAPKPAAWSLTTTTEPVLVGRFAVPGCALAAMAHLMWLA